MVIQEIEAPRRAAMAEREMHSHRTFKQFFTYRFSIHPNIKYLDIVKIILMNRRMTPQKATWRPQFPILRDRMLKPPAIIQDLTGGVGWGAGIQVNPVASPPGWPTAVCLAIIRPTIFVCIDCDYFG